jgi:predicted DNA binding CopG/RHH family protein
MMSKFKPEAFMPLDEEERELMESLESDTWQPVANFEEEKEKAETAARNSIKKDKRINLRLTQKDYYEIQVKAIEEGVPYQTLIASIVHKYLNGQLITKES